MSLGSFLKFSNTLATDALSFFYQGDFDDQFTAKIIELGEYNIDGKKELKKSRKKFSFLVAECFQNVVRHGQLPEGMEKQQLGFFATRNIDSTFFITSSNLIANQHISKLEEDLQKVNSLDRDELKAYYREVLNTTQLSDDGGAGLGLIEMARRSGQPLEYTFEKVNDEWSWFYLQIRICASEEALYDQIDIDDFTLLHQDLIEEDILLMYKGDFVEDSIMPLLNMIENNMDSQFPEFKKKKKVYMFAVELLQNISRHAASFHDTLEGLFLIGRSGDHFVLATGNFIHTDKVEALKSHLDLITVETKEALSERYKSILKQGNEDPEGLGLIGIVKDASGGIEYNFEPVDTELTYFSLSVKL